MTTLARPRSITLIAWLAFLYGVLSLGWKVRLALSPEALALTRDFFVTLNEGALVQLPFEAHMAHGFTSSVAFAVGGVFMLLGHNWARLLLLIWPLTALALTFSVSGLSLPLGLKTLTYCLLAFFLLRGASVRYFQARQAVAGAA